MRRSRLREATGELLRLFEEMFREVRDYLLGEGLSWHGAVQVNARGDTTREFDYRAEEIALDVARRGAKCPLRILTEERGKILVGEGKPAYTLFLDPVDGSANYLRGIRQTGFSIAAVPGPGPWDPARVACGLIGDVFGGDVYTAARGGGAFQHSRPIRASTCTALEEAGVIFELNSQDRGRLREVLPLAGRVKDIRYLASSSLELAAVARGAMDARVDLRGTSTPENWLAAIRLIPEAGGVVTDGRGKPLSPLRALTHATPLVVAGTPALHQAIIDVLQPEV